MSITGPKKTEASRLLLDGVELMYVNAGVIEDCLAGARGCRSLTMLR